MKKLLILPLLFLVFNALGQIKPVKIVFDVTSHEESAQSSAIRHLKAMAAAYPDSKFELVIYGESLPMALKDNPSTSNDILQLVDKDNVSIKVCEGTLKRKGVDKAQLVTGIGTVPDGILEIIDKQSQGWGYIKETP